MAHTWVGHAPSQNTKSDTLEWDVAAECIDWPCDDEAYFAQAYEGKFGMFKSGTDACRKCGVLKDHLMVTIFRKGRMSIMATKCIQSLDLPLCPCSDWTDFFFFFFLPTPSLSQFCGKNVSPPPPAHSSQK